jgi:hypothetical protein
MKRINGFLLGFFILVSFSSSIVFAQLKEMKLPPSSSSSAKYYENGNKLYTNSIYVKFKEKVFDSPKGQLKAMAEKTDQKYAAFPNELNKLKKKFGGYELIKMVPDAEWGDNVRKHKRTGENVVLKDMSQYYTIKFTSPFPMDSVISLFESLPFVEHVGQMPIIEYLASPNDPIFISPGQWNLQVINAAQAWDKTTGSTNIKVGILDNGCYSTHEDLSGKIVGGDTKRGDHGTRVAGVIGAKTNNGIGIASLGWNISLYSYNTQEYNGELDNDLAAAAITQATQTCDIINMSWRVLFPTPSPCDPNELQSISMPYDPISDALINAMSQGVVCVASAGNTSPNTNFPEECDKMKIPYTCYPASEPGVIGVSATMLSNGNEIFRTGYNYGVNVDLSAPGDNIKTTDPTDPTGYATVSGTSFSAPLVSALAGLILSINPTLSVADVTKVLINSTDKIDAAAHPYNASGWNQYHGYGRINAKKAVDNVPKAPTGLTVTWQEFIDLPELSWNANSETNITGYEIWGKEGSGAWQLIWTADGTNWTDHEFFNYAPVYYYKLRAKNSLTIYSDFGTTVQFNTPLAKRVYQDLNQAAEFLPTEYSISQNYPNPFNPSTVISYDIPEASRVTLKVYDILGREVADLVDEFKEAGRYNVKFDASHLSTGIYIYQLRANDYVSVKKMSFVK